MIDAVSAILDRGRREDSLTAHVNPISGICEHQVSTESRSGLTSLILRSVVIVLLVGLLGTALATIVVGWIKERDIWLLVPTFWLPIVFAIPLALSLRRRRRRT